MPLFCNPSTKILLVCYNISVKTLLGSSYLHMLCRRFMFHVFYTYVYWRPIIFPFQIRLVSLNTSGAEIVCRFGVPEFILGLCFFVFGSYCSVLSFLCNVLRIIVCRMYLSYCLWSCLLFDLWLLIPTVVFQDFVVVYGSFIFIKYM